MEGLYIMITILTKASSTSSRKAVAWLQENGLKYEEIKVSKTPERLTTELLKSILEKTDRGFEDIVSKRSQAYEKYPHFNNLQTNVAIRTIQKNIGILKYPIIFDDKKLQVGFKEDDMTKFIPPEQRKAMLHQLLGQDFITNPITT